MAWPAIAAGLSAVGMISGFIGSNKASSAAKKQAKAQAAIDKKVTAEELRMLNQEERIARGETMARYAGSGVQVSDPGLKGARRQMSSPLAVLAEQAAEYGRQKKFTADVGAANAQATLTRGRNLADQYRYQGYANVANSISNIMGMNNFWGTGGP